MRAKAELLDLETSPPFESDWFDRREIAQREIQALADVVSQAIRQRLATIVIQEGPGHPLPQVEGMTTESEENSDASRE